MEEGAGAPPWHPPAPPCLWKVKQDADARLGVQQTGLLGAPLARLLRQGDKARPGTHQALYSVNNYFLNDPGPLWASVGL